MTAFDPDKYSSPIVPTQSNQLTTVKHQPKENSPISMVILGVGVLVMVASTGSAIPGIQRQYQANQAVQDRNLANGFSSDLQGRELKEAIKNALPVVDEKTGNLVNVGWKSIIDSELAPGLYLTQTYVLLKAKQGAKVEGDQGQLAGHRIGYLSPEQANERLKAYNKSK